MSARRRSSAGGTATAATSSSPSPSPPPAVSASSTAARKRRAPEEEDASTAAEDHAHTAKKAKPTSASASAKKAAAKRAAMTSADKSPLTEEDTEMTDAPPLQTATIAPAAPAASDEEEKKESAAATPEAAESSEDDDGGEYGAADEGADRTDLYQPALDDTAEVTDDSDPFGCVQLRVDRVLHQLSPQHVPAAMPGLESQQQELYELLTRTMNASVNNAALVLGARGSGKTSLVNMCLRQLREEWKLKGQSFVEVRLDGNIQTDDTLAMREIVFQLCRDHELEQLKETMDFHAHLAFLLDILGQGTFHEIPIFFILDDFHLFTQRAKQTLLYNLCDLLQSDKAQICIIGVTPSLDCYERLEKRIRSRMSHRRILMGPQRAPQVDSEGNAVDMAVSLKVEQPKRQAQLRQIIRSWLELPATPPAPTNAPGIKPSDKARSTAAATTAAISPYVVAHNASSDRLLSPQHSPRLHALLSFHASGNRSCAFFQQALKLALCAGTGPRHPHLTETDVLWAMQYIKKDWTREALKNCSVLELTLLSGLIHLSRRHLTHQNFHLVYSTYRAFHARQSVGGFVHAMPFFTEPAALKAFENLLAQQQLVVWAEHAPTHAGGVTDQSYTGRTIQRRFLPVRLILSEHDFALALKQRIVDAPTWLVLWANNRAD